MINEQETNKLKISKLNKQLDDIRIGENILDCRRNIAISELKQVKEEELKAQAIKQMISVPDLLDIQYLDSLEEQDYEEELADIEQIQNKEERFKAQLEQAREIK